MVPSVLELRWLWLKRSLHSKSIFFATVLVVTMAVALFASANYTGEISARLQIAQSINQLPYEFTVGTGSLLSSRMYTNMSSNLNGVTGVETAELRSSTTFHGNVSGAEGAFELFGIPRNSRTYSDVTLLDGEMSARQNVVYVWSASTNASRLRLGNSIEANFSFLGSPAKGISLTRSFVVGAFISIDQRALAELTGLVITDTLIPASAFSGTVLLTDWNATFAGLVDSAGAQGVTIDPFNTQVYLYVKTSDFSSLDLQSSITRAKTLQQQLEAQASGFQAGVFGTAFLVTLQSENATIESARQFFLFAALPVLLVAWYLIAAMFSMLWRRRRRDVALYLVKGFFPSRLLRMSLMEGILIGAVGTFTGIALGILLSMPTIVAANFNWMDVAFGDSFVYSALFGLGTAPLFIVYPSWKTIQLPITQSLGEAEDSQPSSLSASRLIWWAMLLVGLCGAVVSFGFPSGRINLRETLPAGLLAQILDAFAFPIVILAPFLLLWGSAKLIINSDLVERISALIIKPLTGNLTWIATRSIRRNVSWLFRFTILLALIVSYLVLSLGFVSSQSDYAIRNAESVVGSDIGVSVPTLPNDTVTHSRALSVANSLKNWQGVYSTTVEYSAPISLNYSRAQGPTVPVKVVDSVSWIKTAYYEHEWFSSDPSLLFLEMQSNNQTIILSKDFVLSIMVYTGQSPIGATLPFRLTFSNQTVVRNLKVIGLFGPASQTLHAEAPGPSWSYVPEALFGDSNPSISSATILVKVAGQNAAAVRARISDSIPGVDAVSSEELLSTLPLDPTTTVMKTILNLGLLPIAVVSYVGLATLVFESLELERRNNGLLLLRGFSTSKTRTLSVCKFLPIIVLSGLLGIIVGYTLLVALVNSLNIGQLALVTMRPVLGSITPELVISYLVLLLVGIFTAVIIETKNQILKSSWADSDES